MPPSSSSDPTSEQILSVIQQSLQRLQADVVMQLREDVAWLRSEKETLQRDIESLRLQRQQLLTENQIAQQQQWAQEFAKILARYLQQQLHSDVQTLLHHTDDRSPSNLDREWLDRAYQNQLSRIEQILSQHQAVLLHQISTLAFEDPIDNPDTFATPATVPPFSPAPQPTPILRVVPSPTPSVPGKRSPENPPIPIASFRVPQSSGAAIPRMNWNRFGVTFGILSILILALQYVVAQAFFQFPADPNLTAVQDLEIKASWTNTALLVGLRMVVFLPLITIVNRWLHPNIGKAFQDFLQRSEGQLWWNLGISGLLLFLSQWILYRGVGLTSAGLAVSLFFIYPGLVPLFNWGLTGDRPSQFRFQCVLALGVGAILIFSQPSLNAQSISSLLTWGVVSAAFFAGYLVMTDRCHRHLNSGVVSLVQYGFVVLFAIPALFNFPEISSIQLTKLGVGGMVLGFTAALSYILNVFAVQMMGALPSMILNSLTPLLTAVLGLLLLKSPLAVPHLLGILLITIGCIALNLERIRPPAA